MNTHSFSLSVLSSMICGICVGWYMRGVWGKKRDRAAGPGGAPIPAEESFADGSETGECKLMLVVRNDLKMGKGKTSAQCCHGAVMAYKQIVGTDPDMLKLWEMSGQKKVIVKVEDEASLLELGVHAKSVGLITSMVCDAGHTQVTPGTKTVLGVGPGPEELINRVTGHLKLL